MERKSLGSLDGWWLCRGESAGGGRAARSTWGDGLCRLTPGGASTGEDLLCRQRTLKKTHQMPSHWGV